MNPNANREDDWFARNAPQTPQLTPNVPTGVTYTDPRTGNVTTIHGTPPNYIPPKDIQTVGADGVVRDGSGAVVPTGGITGKGSSTAKPTTGTGSGKSFKQLVNDWQHSHPASNPDMDGLVKYLADNGVTVTRAKHGANNSETSDDKIIYDGKTYDIGTSLGGPNAGWFDDFGPQDEGGGSGDGKNPYDYPSFDQTYSFPTWDKSFTAPTKEQALNDPGYAFAREQGEKGILQNAAKMGIARTQGTVKDLDQFNVNLADMTYQNVYGRAVNDYNLQLQAYLSNMGLSRDIYNAALQKYGVNQGNFFQGIDTEQRAQNQAFNQQYSLADLGFRAAGGQANAYNNYGTGAANIYATSGGRQADYATQIGNAQASGQVGSANAYANAYTSGANDLSFIYANQGKSIYRNPRYRTPYGSDPGGG